MRPVLICVTGNAAGGKSTFMDILAKYGHTIIKADELAKNVIYVPENYEDLKQIFDKPIFDQNGNIDFQKISDIFFRLDDEAKRIRKLISEYFQNDIWNEINRQVIKAHKLFAFVESASMSLEGAQTYFNYIICVHCNPEESRKRMLSRGWSEERIDVTTKIQLPVEIKIGLSDCSLDTTNIPLNKMEEVVKELIESIGIKM